MLMDCVLVRVRFLGLTTSQTPQRVLAMPVVQDPRAHFSLSGAFTSLVREGQGH